MDLYLMRHAEAADLSAGGFATDAERPLTEKGQRQSRRVGALLKRLDVTLDLVLTSPLTRAHETAKAVVEAMESDAKIRTLDALTPDAEDDAAWQAISRSGGESVLVVGHLPSIASLAGSLLGSLAEAPLHFQKASIAALACERPGRKPRVTLEWMLSPGLVKRLAGRHRHGEESDGRG